jgi:hypothetical protein
MPTHDETLKENFREIVSPLQEASRAIREPKRYWREGYSRDVPNAEIRIVPSSFMDDLNEFPRPRFLYRRKRRSRHATS